jgi:dihydroorotate dehydrogenase
MMYTLLRKLLFQFPPESVHNMAMDSLGTANRFPPARTLLRSVFTPSRPELARNAWGLAFRNPVGLGAGFDKNARYLPSLDTLGFGFVEVGTVTPRAQPGNERPRLFRLPADRALINRMGFNNDGMDVVAARLRRWRKQYDSTLIVGGNIGRNKDTPNEDAWKDYERCFLSLCDTVDYFVVNVSSPNTPGLRALQEKGALRQILGRVQDINQGLAIPKPLLLKIAPDLTDGQLDDIIDLAEQVQLSGLVATNTTISRDGLRTPAAGVAALGAGGLSGAPLGSRTNDVIRYIHQRAASLPIIGSGGIFTAEDARQKLDAGAALVQVWTGFIYEGPGIVGKICKGLK